jgi:hypothetical protein
VVASAIVLLGWFSREISDTDFWWHFRTGQYIWEHRTLPVPDPFAYTTENAASAYPGEERTRYFNLTHEWLAQFLTYMAYRAGGFPAVVLFRATLLTGFSAIVGLVAYWRSGGYFRGVGASFAAAGAAIGFASDRPFLITFLLLAATIAILEARRRRWIWVLPLLFVFWANCHGGFFLGWIVLAAYCLQYRDRRLWLASGTAIAASALNPNGFLVPWILASYRDSFMQSRLQEWAAPRLWPPGLFTFLLAGSAAVLILARRRARLADWLLFAAFTAAALTAQRNTILIGLIAPIIIASYTPEWKGRFARTVPWVAAAAVQAVLPYRSFFQLRVNPWKWPQGAADFLLARGITLPMFNTYEYGGYLIWRLWPRQRVFIDGRALSESVFKDYTRILYNHDASDGKSAGELLREYGVQVILMNGFEYVSGEVYLLAPALADPQQREWKLVYADPQSMVFMRTPPPGVEPMPSLRVLDHLEAECDLHLRYEPQYPRCARSLGQVFLKVGDVQRARRWIGRYLTLHRAPDPEAEEAYGKLLSGGH